MQKDMQYLRSDNLLRKLFKTNQGTNSNNLIGHKKKIHTQTQAYETIAIFKCQFKKENSK